MTLTDFDITTTLLAKELNSFTLLSQVFRLQSNEYLEQQATKKSEEVARKVLEKVRQNNPHNPAVEMEKFVAAQTVISAQTRRKLMELALEVEK